jgi:hypothetical protein
MSSTPAKFDRFWWWVIAAFALLIAAWTTIILIAANNPNPMIDIENPKPRGDTPAETDQ